MANERVNSPTPDCELVPALPPPNLEAYQRLAWLAPVKRRTKLIPLGEEPSTELEYFSQDPLKRSVR